MRRSGYCRKIASPAVAYTGRSVLPILPLILSCRSLHHRNDVSKPAPQESAQESAQVRQTMLEYATAHLSSLFDGVVSLGQAILVGCVLAASWQSECDKPLKTYGSRFAKAFILSAGSRP